MCGEVECLDRPRGARAAAGHKGGFPVTPLSSRWYPTAGAAWVPSRAILDPRSFKDCNRAVAAGAPPAGLSTPPSNRVECSISSLAKRVCAVHSECCAAVRQTQVLTGSTELHDSSSSSTSTSNWRDTAGERGWCGSVCVADVAIEFAGFAASQNHRFQLQLPAVCCGQQFSCKMLIVGCLVRVMCETNSM